MPLPVALLLKDKNRICTPAFRLLAHLPLRVKGTACRVCGYCFDFLRVYFFFFRFWSMKSLSPAPAPPKGAAKSKTGERRFVAE